MHRMLCAREFSYREFSIRPKTGIIQRFLNGEIFSMSSRSRLVNETKQEQLWTTVIKKCEEKKPNPCTYSSSRLTGRPNSISRKHSRSPWLP